MDTDPDGVNASRPTSNMAAYQEREKSGEDNVDGPTYEFNPVNSAPGYEPGIARDGINRRVLSAYSVGHFGNDLCASMWFIYLSYYLVYVVNLTENVAGLALLSGQITDGITTPIVGILSDKVNCACGKRNAWFYFGSLLVVPAFLCIFLDIQFTSETMTNAWYITWPAIFNVGWASVQIAHLSIVVSIAYSQRKRD